jgi:hypothetical protein
LANICTRAELKIWIPAKPIVAGSHLMKRYVGWFDISMNDPGALRVAL